MRSGPGLDYNIIEELTEYRKLMVLSHEKDWYKIELAIDKSGWVYAPLVSPFSLSWNCYRGNSERTASLDESVTIEGKKKWELDIKSNINFNSSPVSCNGKVYIGSEKGKLFCIDGKKCSIDWTFQAEAPIESTPAINGDYLYFESEDGIVYCIDLSSGHKVWKFSRDGTTSGNSPLIMENNLIYVIGNNNRTIYALTLDKGQEKWRFSLENGFLSPPCIADEGLYFGSSSGDVYCLSKEKGSVKWKSNCKYCTGLTFSSEDFLYVLVNNTEAINHDDFYISLYALDKITGVKKWSYDFSSQVFTPVLMDNIVYIASYDKNIYAIDAKNGKQKWSIKGETYPVIMTGSGSVLYIVLYDCTVYALDSKTKKRRWTLNFDSMASSPAITGNNLYLATEDGIIYSIE
ncbi:MAG TPA: PQQ-binding-like beta-propeller repeat protein [Candidatus Eremiobacteraeota bacterium]|nr:PQQ-binding-like beta-propeller repeat protein [Candidatus Eremiobacteraeota bacterium]